MTIFAETCASAVGIGSRMNLAQATFHIDQLIAWTFLLVHPQSRAAGDRRRHRTVAAELAARGDAAVRRRDDADRRIRRHPPPVRRHGRRRRPELSVAPGEIVSLLGRTGAGKSTVLNLVMGTMAPTQGRVRVAGFDPFEDFKALRGKLAVSFQTDRLLPWRNAVENAEARPVDSRCRGGGGPCQGGRLARAGRAAGRRDKYAHELSGGMRGSACRWPARSRSIRRWCCSMNRSASSTT